ncbi:MAG: response regulator [Planctomycetota bacterium]
MMKIAYVHDEQSAPDGRARALEEAGFVVEMIADGARALDRVERTRPDLVLLDVLVPGANGFELARRLRTRFATEDLRIGLCAGIFRGEAYRRAAAEAGADAYLETGSDPDALLRALLAAFARPGVESAVALGPVVGAGGVPRIEEVDLTPSS